MNIKLITKQTMYRNLKNKEVCIVKLDTGCRTAIGLPVYGTFSGGLRGMSNIALMELISLTIR